MMKLNILILNELFFRCWPQKIMPTVREFFRERFQHHLTIYRHPTTQAFSFMICDILLLADPFFKLSTEDEMKGGCKDDPILYLPISRANLNPISYWKLDDSILDLIHKSTDPNLLPARQLINRLKSRKLYKLCGELDIEDEVWENKLWHMTEDDIISKLLKFSDCSGEPPIHMEEYFIIVEKRSIHHGMGATDRKSRMGNSCGTVTRCSLLLTHRDSFKLRSCQLCTICERSNRPHQRP